MTDSGSNTIVSNVSYDAANRLLTMNYPGANETRSYNVLGQLTNIHAGSSENLTYNYPAGTNNGKVNSMYNAISGETVTYTYDSLNRLATAGGSGWGEAYTFDPFGNLTNKQVTSGTGPSLSVSVNQSNNEITSVYGQSYDANGNTTDSNMTAYDAENHLVGAGWNLGAPAVDYGYDAQGKRSFMWTAGTFDWWGGGNATNYSVVMYSPSGQKLGTYQISVCNQGPNNTIGLTICSALQTSDKYFGGRRLAVLDQLGSAGTYYPWGEAKGTTNPQDAWSYATYWRDSATGLDYANQRYYSNAYGRFMTPDPYVGNSNGAGDPQNPQTWNRYAYASGDPVNSYDPRGLWAAPPRQEEGEFGNNSCGEIWIWDASLSGPCQRNSCFASDGITPTPGPNCINSRGGAPAPAPRKPCVGTDGRGVAGTLYLRLHQSGRDWSELTNDLKSIKNSLAKDLNCDDLLTSAGADMSQINNILSNPSIYFSVALTILTSNNASLFGTTNDLIGGPAIVLLEALFYGGDQENEELTILHELAHYTHVFGPENADNNPTSTANDTTITQNCSKTLLGN